MPATASAAITAGMCAEHNIKRAHLMPKCSSAVEENLSGISVEHTHALSATTLQ